MRPGVVTRGVRYRLSAGVGQAMRIWGIVLVAIAVAEDLEASLPLPGLRAAIAIGVGISVLTQPILRRILRAPYEAHVMLLPLEQLEARAIDTLAVLLFLLPPHVALVIAVAIKSGVLRALALALILLMCGAAQAALLGPQRRTSSPACPPKAGWRAGPTFPTRGYELRWLFRTGGSRIGGGVIGALLMAGCAELAIRNNDVVRLASIARIAGAFGAIGAAFIVSEVIAARHLARPWRASELALPIEVAVRLRSMLVASLSLGLPFVIVVALLRPIALPVIVATYLFAMLVGESRSLARGNAPAGVIFGVASAAAALAALNALVAFVMIVAALPLAWRACVRHSTSCDAPTVAEAAA